jgi:hypothetical protein
MLPIGEKITFRIGGGAPRPVTVEATTPPSAARRGANFAKASIQHIASGAPLASDAQVAERFAICLQCPLYRAGKQEGVGQCLHPSCGCKVKAVGLTGLNKLRWADQRCPLGHWHALPTVSPETGTISADHP